MSDDPGSVGMLDEPGRTVARAGLLLSLWQVRADLYRSLETHTREALAGSNVMTPDDVEDFIEQQIATEQTEYIAQFLFVLHCAGCSKPARLGAYIDRHNAMIDRFLAELDKLDGVARPLGARHKQRLWRLKNARFNERIKAGTLDRLAGGRLVLSLKDIERFMAMHMDPTLCRDRLDALIKVGLLRDDVRPNIRLIWSEGSIEALVASHLDAFAQQLEELTHAPA
jgi:hypothetical protein